MAESVSHRLNEYLRNGQANEGTNQSNQIQENNQDGSGQPGKNPDWEMQRYRSRDKRSTVTSFADLYERAVKNLLNIRPLFDSPLDIFGAKGIETASYAQPSLHSQARSFGPERGVRRETRDRENENQEKQNHRISDIALGTPDYLSRDNENSTNGFFAQILSEHARQNRQSFPYSSQRHGLPLIQNERASQRSDRKGPNSSFTNGHEHKNEHRTDTNPNQGKNEMSGGQRVMYEQHNYWRHNNDHPHRHRPSMFDDLRYHARLVLSAEVNSQKNRDDKDVAVTTESKNCTVINEQLQSDQIDNKEDDKTSENEYIKTKDAKLTEKEQMDLIRERIIKENQKLKYRPYSLRSKRNDLKSSKKKIKKKQLKRKKSVKNLWKPSSPQEIFLFQFGLMRKMADPAKLLPQVQKT